MIKITLSYKCPLCGSNLILLEKKRYVEIMCPRCGIGLREDKNLLRETICNGRTVEWKDAIIRLVLDFYNSTPAILRIRRICKLNKGTHILENVG